MEAWRRGIRPSSNEEPPWDLKTSKISFIYGFMATHLFNVDNTSFSFFEFLGM